MFNDKATVGVFKYYQTITQFERDICPIKVYFYIMKNGNKSLCYVGPILKVIS